MLDPNWLQTMTTAWMYLEITSVSYLAMHEIDYSPDSFCRRRIDGQLHVARDERHMRASSIKSMGNDTYFVLFEASGIPHGMFNNNKKTKWIKYVRTNMSFMCVLWVFVLVLQNIWIGSHWLKAIDEKDLNLPHICHRILSNFYYNIQCLFAQK